MNNENLQLENKTFYEWMESLNTAYCYLMHGNNKTYVGISYKDNEYVLKFNDNMEETLKRLKFNKRKTNKDSDKEIIHSAYDKNRLKRCRELAEKEYKKDACLIITKNSKSK